MKYLLFTLLATFIFIESTFSQQKLIGTTQYNYDSFGTLSQIDSSSFLYGSNLGALYSNEPVFGYDKGFVNWFYTQPLIVCNKEYKYAGQAGLLIDTINYELTSGYVTVKQTTLNPTRELFTYNANNDLISIEKQVLYSFNTNYVFEQKTEYEYTPTGKRALVRVYFSEPNIQISSDSLFYNADDQLVRVVITNYSVSTGQPSPYFEFNISYNGNEISNVKSYSGNTFQFAQLRWDLDYFYTAGKLTLIEGENLAEGSIATINHTYDNNGRILEIEAFQDNALNKVAVFEYDDDGFITREKYSERGPIPNQLFVSSDKYFYYETSNVGIEDQASISSKLYPNPALEQITIKTDVSMIGQEYFLFDLVGNLITKGKITGINTSLSLLGLASGSYIIAIQGQEKKSFKIIKE
ncbi:MAG: T9SS type A sorting domain-containing protein [Flavobacteriales bacterium]|jgi:hypothetical protein|nr:T9SS type A sorting domain-containing protein [Flavobacteriales bacterium]